MKVFIFCGPIAFGKGGMEKVAANLANHLTKDHVVTMGYFVRPKQCSPCYYLDDMVILAPWNIKSESGRSEYARRIAESNPDIFIYFGASSQALQVISLLYGANIPLLIHEGSNPDRVIKDNWAKVREISRREAAWEREALYSQASVVRFTMPEYLTSLPKEMRKFAVTFPNAFGNDGQVADVVNSKNIINIGGLKENKNAIPLLKSFAKLSGEFPDWELHIYSAVYNSKSGKEYLNKFTDALDALGIHDKVYIHGGIENISREYLSSAVHVITSLSEGLSNAVAESMTYGLPSIGVSGVPGVDGLIRDGENGFLVNKNSLVDDLFDALRKLVHNASLRAKLGACARKDAQMFSPPIVYQKWESAIYNCIQERSHDPTESYLHYQRELLKLYSKAVRDFDERDVVRVYSDSLSNLRPVGFAELKQKKEGPLLNARWLND